MAGNGDTGDTGDAFGRTVTDGWGSAPIGGGYTLQGGAANYDVTGAAATIALNAAGGNRSAVLAGVSAQDVDVSFRVRTDKASAGGSQFIYGIARRTGTDEYRAKLRLAPNGKAFVAASAVIDGVETPIASEVEVAGLDHLAGSYIQLRAQVTGTSPTTIRVRAWADNDTEPTTWRYTATDSTAALQDAGAGASGPTSAHRSPTPRWW